MILLVAPAVAVCLLLIATVTADAQIVIATENFGSFIRRRRECKKCNGKFYGTEEFSGIIDPPPGYVPVPPQQLKFAEN